MLVGWQRCCLLSLLSPPSADPPLSADSATVYQLFISLSLLFTNLEFLCRLEMLPRTTSNPLVECLSDRKMQFITFPKLSFQPDLAHISKQATSINLNEVYKASEKKLSDTQLKRDGSDFSLLILLDSKANVGNRRDVNYALA